ncbi:MAG: hypothetical protein EOP39_13650 [Rubrivivax sp.]|nr:MAG: hypothetical protein EOP39_13650 [Rubrivivax sp.]
MHTTARLALWLACTVLPPLASASYEVKLAPGARQLTLSLALPPGARAGVRLAPRGAAWGLKPQVEDVRCAGRPLPQDAEGHWLAPASCTRVTWRVVPDAVSADGADASEQRTLAIAKRRWVLLAEPTALLRPQGVDAASTLRAAKGSVELLGATPMGRGGWRVPPGNSAPEFYVLGRAQVVSRQQGAFAVRYVADDPELVKQLNLQALHAAALAQLVRVVPLPPATSPADRSLLVVWLGVAASRGSAGGAAGSRSFVANYVRGEPADAARHAALTLGVAAHEQFHQLVELFRNRHPATSSAVWFDESLAHFYGLKALRAADKSRDAQALWARSVDLQRPVEHGLLELHRRHEAGDASVYESFYSQGAAFWHAVDTAISAATQGQQSLDDHLGDVLRAPLSSDGALPESLVQRLRAVAGPAIDDALTRYVTGPR